MNGYYTKITILIFLIFSVKIFSQQLILSEKATVSVLTCDQGNQLHSLFGHTAIRINDPVAGFDAVYNFGYFDFNTPNFYLKFVKGDMKYFVAVDSFENFMTEYIYYNRGVYEQTLHLSDTEKQQIFQKLNLILQSQDRFYTYKFIDRNCTTMVADLLQKIAKLKFSRNIKGNNETNREILYGYLSNHFYENLGINIIFGQKVDVKFDKIFLPLQLLESIGKSKNTANEKLVLDTKTLNNQSIQNDFSIWNNIYSLIIILGLVVFLNNNKINSIYFVMIGIIGIFLFSVSFYSFHEEVTMNYNILLFNPLLILIPFISNNKILRILLTIIMATIVIYLVYIITKPFILIVLPIIVTNLYISLKKYNSRKTA